MAAEHRGPAAVAVSTPRCGACPARGQLPPPSAVDLMVLTDGPGWAHRWRADRLTVSAEVPWPWPWLQRSLMAAVVVTVCGPGASWTASPAGSGVPGRRHPSHAVHDDVCRHLGRHDATAGGPTGDRCHSRRRRQPLRAPVGVPALRAQGHAPARDWGPRCSRPPRTGDTPVRGARLRVAPHVRAARSGRGPLSGPPAPDGDALRQGRPPRTGDPQLGCEPPAPGSGSPDGCDGRGAQWGRAPGPVGPPLRAPRRRARWWGPEDAVRSGVVVQMPVGRVETRSGGPGCLVECTCGAAVRGGGVPAPEVAGPHCDHRSGTSSLAGHPSQRGCGSPAGPAPAPMA